MRPARCVLAVFAALAGAAPWCGTAGAIPSDGGGLVPPGQTPAPASPDPYCSESYADDPPAAGPAIHWGAGPLLSAGGPAGDVGGAPTPERAETADARLRALRPQGAPFALRLNRFFSGDGDAGIARYKALTDRFTRQGFDVEFQLRYHPTPERNGDIDAWLGFVRRVVREFGPNPRVTGIQVTNEVNLKFSPNTSDGYYARAEDALVDGVVAAKEEATRLGFRQLAIGFNWFYRVDPSTDRAFWQYLSDHGGRRFQDAVDWVGIDIYPGTLFPPRVNDLADALLEGVSALRECYMPTAGLGRSKPIRVEEIGYATGPGRPEADQLEAVNAFVSTTHRYRGTYNLSDFRWFALRDNNTSGPAFTSHYGLLRDDYSPKPAFARYCELVARYSPARPGAACGGADADRAGCLARRAPIGARNIGRVRLGMTRPQLRRRLPEPSRTTRRSWRWCVKGGRGSVSAAFSRRGRVALVLTTAPGHGNRRIHPGSSVRRLRRAYPRARRVGARLVRAGPRSRRLLGLSRRRVRFFAVAGAATISRPARLRAYVRLAR